MRVVWKGWSAIGRDSIGRVRGPEGQESLGRGGVQGLAREVVGRLVAIRWEMP
jgi:hypothetical protein